MTTKIDDSKRSMPETNLTTTTITAADLAGRRIEVGQLPDDIAAVLRQRSSASTENKHVNITAPFLGEPIGYVHEGSEADVEEAFKRARSAQKRWSRTPVEEREEIALRLHDLIFDHQGLMLDIIQLETGKSRSAAFDEFMDAVQTCRYYGNRAAKFLNPQKREGALPVLTKTREYHQPKGVVGIVSPWNYPLALTLSDAIPALLAGNAVVMKPDSNTPFTALYGALLLDLAGLDPELLQIVTGPGRVVGSGIADRCNILMFTGSTATGKHLASQVANRLVSFSAELGGKNPMIVAADANVKRAGWAATRGCFANTGQLCVSVERIYVQSGVFQEFLDTFKAETEALSIGAGFEWEATVGSLASQDQFDTVKSMVDAAVSKGAHVVCGGRARPDLGPLFYEPTILTDVPDDAELKRGEVFGPVVYVESVDTLEEGVARANDTDYGLNASVWAAPKTGWRIAPQIESGTVNINEGFVAAWGSTDAPMGGFKESGMGRRHGREGLLKFTESQNIAEQRLMLISGPKWMSHETYAKVITPALYWGRKFRVLR